MINRQLSTTLPVAQDVLPLYETYSYGDSPGFPPGSLFILKQEPYTPQMYKKENSFICEVSLFDNKKLSTAQTYI